MHKKKDNQSIGYVICRKMISMVIISTLILGSICAFLIYYSAMDILNRNMNETSSLAAGEIQGRMQKITAIAYETGSIARLANEEKTIEEKQSIINQRVETHDLSRGTLVDASGMDVFNGIDVSKELYYTEAIKGNTYISDPVIDEITGEYTLKVSAPLWEGGIPNTTVVGVIVYVPKADFLHSIINNIRIGDGGNAYILNSAGDTIATSEEAILSEIENVVKLAETDKSLKALAELEKRMVAGEDGFGSYTYDGVIEVLSFSPIAETPGWSVGICAVQSEFLTAFYISIVCIVALFVGLTLMGVIQGMRLGKKIREPLNMAGERLEMLVKGDLTTPVPTIKEENEIKKLLASLQLTIDNLQMIIRDISTDLKEIEGGNLTIEINKIYEGDFSAISYSMKEIIATLKKTMMAIHENAQRVTAGSEDLSNAAQNLADGSTDQASSVEELTATITELSSQINDNAKSADAMNEQIIEVNKQIDSGNVSMVQLKQAMDKIKESSSEIAKVIQTIEDIANQTNLLSLNASIEAARAGEAGRGFAVVADEVRNLADQSREAANQTAAMIDTSIRAVEEGNELTKVTASALDQVIAAANEVASTAEKISKSCRQQAVEADQISDAVNQISAVVEENSATAEETSASSEELSAEAVNLKQMIDRFKY